MDSRRRRIEAASGPQNCSGKRKLNSSAKVESRGGENQKNLQLQSTHKETGSFELALKLIMGSKGNAQLGFLRADRRSWQVGHPLLRREEQLFLLHDRRQGVRERPINLYSWRVRHEL
jgi:hypothetical protein